MSNEIFAKLQTPRVISQSLVWMSFKSECSVKNWSCFWKKWLYLWQHLRNFAGGNKKNSNIQKEFSEGSHQNIHHLKEKSWEFLSGIRATNVIPPLLPSSHSVIYPPLNISFRDLTYMNYRKLWGFLGKLLNISPRLSRFFFGFWAARCGISRGGGR